MRGDDERNAAVEAHLRALDEEIARLRREGAALDRRIADAERERRRAEGEEPDSGPDAPGGPASSEP